MTSGYQLHITEIISRAATEAQLASYREALKARPGSVQARKELWVFWQGGPREPARTPRFPRTMDCCGHASLTVHHHLPRCGGGSPPV